MDDDVRVIAVFWSDAFMATEHWTTTDELEHDARIIMTTGVQLPDPTDEHIIVAQSIDFEGDKIDSVLCIPKHMVMGTYSMGRALNMPRELKKLA